MPDRELGSMYCRTRTAALAIAISGIIVEATVASGAQKADTATLKNPLAQNAASLGVGKKLFSTNCVACHGDTGKGDVKSAATLKPKPSDLTDAEWKHGSSDGEIFALIRDGAKQTSMRGYAGKLTGQELWSLVNYVRSLGPTTSKSQ